MRERRAHDDPWGALYDHFTPDDDPRREDRRQRFRRRSLSPDSADRLFGAAIGVLESLRVLVDVAEDVLENERHRWVDPHAGQPRATDTTDETNRRDHGRTTAEPDGHDIPVRGR